MSSTVITMPQPISTNSSDPQYRDEGKAADLSLTLPVSGSTLSFHNIHYTVRIKAGTCKTTEKSILKGITGVFKSGMNAIMGPTGSGKTSLLDVLSARKSKKGLSGQVLVEGKPLPSDFKLMSGYVVQDNVVMETLTVRENLTFSAALRLPASVSKQEREQRVNDVIRELGLHNCADTRIGSVFSRGLSGGEKKRTNMGMELIIQPSILFLDEPTSGLDASTAWSIISILAQLSQKGHTIIFSIHQPRYGIFRRFDKLHLLSNGETVYHGPAVDAVQHFSSNGYICEEHDNPADFFLDSILLNQAAVASSDTTDVAIDAADTELGIDNPAINTENPTKSTDNLRSTEMKRCNTSLKECFQTSEYHTDMTKEVDSIYQGFKGEHYISEQKFSYQTSFFGQLRYVGKRALLNFSRNFKTGLRQIIAAFGYSLVIGTIFFQLNSSADTAVQDRTGALALVTYNMLMQNIPSVDTFISERVLFIHESANGYYRTSSYFIAKIMGDLLPQRTVPTIIYATIVYWMIGFRPDAERFLIFTFTLLLFTYAVVAIYFFIGIFFRTFYNAISVIALFLILQMLFSGFLINIASIPDWLSWLEYLSLIRYNLKVLYINEYAGKVFCNPFPDNSTCIVGDVFLSGQGIDATSLGLWQNELVMGVVFLSFLLLSYINLRRINKFS